MSDTLHTFGLPRPRMSGPAFDRMEAAGKAYQAASTKPPPTPYKTVSDLIKEDACRLFGISMFDLLGFNREARFVRARWYVAQRLRDETRLSLPQIGKRLGGRDHTTILNALTPRAYTSVEKWLEKNVGSLPSKDRGEK